MILYNKGHNELIVWYFDRLNRRLDIHSLLQRKTAVIAYFSSDQLLLLIFARGYHQKGEQL